MTREELLAHARTAALRAHCPYSHFRVGAALLAGGKLYTGVNIEISSYGLTLCAERSALAAAISLRLLLLASIPPLTPLFTSVPPVEPAVNG
jgi:cytidine deaminase